MFRAILHLAAALLTLGMALSSALADDNTACRNSTGEERIAACSRIIKRNPTDALAYYNRAIAYQQLEEKDPDRLFVAFLRWNQDREKAIQLDPKLASDINFCTNSTVNSNDEAIAACSRLIERGRDPGPYITRCQAYSGKGEYDRAIADCSQAIKLIPKNAASYNDRGNVYNAKGDYEHAIADYDQALKLNSSLEEVRQNRDRAQAALAPQTPAKPPVGAQAPAQPAKRALVIGIDSYPNLARAAQLERAVADAEAVGDKLASLGFQVSRLTSSRQGTLAAILHGFEDFKKTIAPNDMVVLFYAGHGLGLSDGTYLLPADVSETSLEVESTARRAAINEHELTDGLQQARAGIVVAIIDACRNDLFSRAVRRGAGNERGLRPAETAGIFKIYSASEGQTALDRLPGGGDGSKNSVFMRVFLKAIGTPGLDLNRLGATVRDEVHEIARSADHQQTPAVYDKLIGSTRVYFMPQTAAAERGR